MVHPIKSRRVELMILRVEKILELAIAEPEITCAGCGFQMLGQRGGGQATLLGMRAGGGTMGASWSPRRVVAGDKRCLFETAKRLFHSFNLSQKERRKNGWGLNSDMLSE